MMKIDKDKVVTLEYTLKNTQGDVLDATGEEAPFAYLHGHHGIIPGLEKSLEGKKQGAEIDVVVPPEEGYGLHDESLIQVVEKVLFGSMLVEPGMQFHAQTNQGNQVVTVTRVDGNEVTIDGNHPLAGETLHFNVRVLGIRDATAEEIAHGHVHGSGGHHH
jgi:FKBP-type peptidyl-prolyl cis-trans isomerase SlyD